MTATPHPTAETARLPALMTAVVAARAGDCDVLVPAQLPVPRPGPGEVLVRVRAAGVNASDRHIRRSQAYIRVLRLLHGGAVAGLEFAGTVVACGPGGGSLAPGDEVYGALPGSRHGGTYAQFVRARSAWCARKPAELPFEEAAALPVGGMTALHMLEQAGAAPGRRILVNGASGAIGTSAVQLARALGCEVTGVCSTANVELVRSLGAHRVVDYRRESVRDAGRFDGIVDAAGLPFEDARAVLRPGGAFTTAVFAFGTVIRLRVRGFKAFAAMVEPRTEALDQLASHVAAGRLRVPVDRVFPLAEAGAAQRHLECGHPRGRVALAVPG